LSVVAEKKNCQLGPGGCAAFPARPASYYWLHTFTMGRRRCTSVLCQDGIRIIDTKLIAVCSLRTWRNSLPHMRGTVPCCNSLIELVLRFCRSQWRPPANALLFNRSGNNAAISIQFLPPCLCTASCSWLSSSAVQ
jgi:hypothetical protein